MRISDWSSYLCSSYLLHERAEAFDFYFACQFVVVGKEPLSKHCKLWQLDVVLLHYSGSYNSMLQQRHVLSGMLGAVVVSTKLVRAHLQVPQQRSTQK